MKPDIHAQEAPRRIPAFVDAAQASRPGHVAAMIRALDDTDPAVRFFAARSLREMTGESFGYVYHRDPEDQREALAAWRAWYEQEHPGQPPLAEEPEPTDAQTAEPVEDQSRSTLPAKVQGQANMRAS